MEIFDVIALNETWLDTQNKHLLAEVSIHGYKVFHEDKPSPSGRGGGSIMYVKNTLNPIERKSSATCTREIIQVDINPKNAVHLKLVLIYIEIKESQQLQVMSSIQCWKKFCYHNMNVSSWEILIFQT